MNQSKPKSAIKQAQEDYDKNRPHYIMNSPTFAPKTPRLRKLLKKKEYDADQG